MDIYPTLCEMAGLKAPEKLDGMSLVKVLKDPEAVTKDHVIHVYPRGGKLGRAIRTSQYRLVEWKDPGAAPTTADLELYDYQSDPLETKNIAAENPEIVDSLRKILSTYPEAKPQFKEGGKSGGKVPPGKAKVDRDILFKRRDADKDGKLTMEEFLKNQPDADQAKSRFPKFDTDGDGFLSCEEFVNRRSF